MTDIEKKALALLKEVQAEYPLLGAEVSAKMALCRAIEQHETFRQEVSDVVSGFFADDGFDRTGLLRRFIIAEPVDPLVAALASIDIGLSDHELQKLKDMGVAVTAPARGDDLRGDFQSHAPRRPLGAGVGT